MARTDGLPWPFVETSALTGQGLPKLEHAMVSAVLGGIMPSSEAVLVANARHKNALERAQAHLTDALTSHRVGLPDDFITIDLTAALNALGEITGETVGEDLIDIIFSHFCIGK
jgi:tRNA modification GTPase